MALSKKMKNEIRQEKKYLIDYQEALTYSKAQLSAMIDARARRANQRLRELEKRGLTGSNAYRYLERNAGNMNGLRHTKEGNIRFGVGASGLNKSQMASILSNIEGFLQAKTSTVSGINRQYKKAYESFVENPKNNAKNLSYKDYMSIMESDNFESFKKSYYSAFKAMISNQNKAKASDIKTIIENSAGRTLKDIEEDFKKVGGTGWITPDEEPLPFD